MECGRFVNDGALTLHSIVLLGLPILYNLSEEALDDLDSVDRADN